MSNSGGANIGVQIQHAEHIGALHIHNAGPAPERAKPRQPFEPETVPVAAGPFPMGREPGEGVPPNEVPRHTVELSAYQIGRYPVTNREYAEFIHASDWREAPDGWLNRQPPAALLNHPATGVSWDDAVAYCDWLAERTGRPYRLPSEAEWERAAAGEQGQRYPWGEAWEEGRCNVAGSGTTAVDHWPSCGSPSGCEDLLGNVEEWTGTLWGNSLRRSAYPYPYRADDGREALDPGPGRICYRICRGGSFKSTAEALCCTSRFYGTADARLGWRGFRVVRAEVDRG